MSAFLRWLPVLALLAASLVLSGSARAIDISGDKTEAQNDLRQIAIFYKTFETERRKPPKSLKEFIDYIKRDAPGLSRNLESGNYILVLTRKAASGKVLAYHKAVYKGMHNVVMGDGAVDTLTPEELKKNLK